MRYGDQELSAGGQRNKVMQVIFDSGSSYTYLPNDAYTRLVALVSSLFTISFNPQFVIVFFLK
jgi:hypothetical protein